MKIDDDLTEPHIESKSKSWIVGLVILAGIIYYALTNIDFGPPTSITDIMPLLITIGIVGAAISTISNV